MAYPLVVSLQQTLEPLLDSVPSKFEISTNSELKLIYEHLRYVKSFFEKVISLEDSNNVEEVEGRIKDVLQSSQDLIESHISDLFHPGPKGSVSGFNPGLVKVNAKLVSFVEELKAKEDYLTEYQQLASGLGSNRKIVGAGDVAASPTIDFGRNNQVIVGMDEEIFMLMEWLTRAFSNLKVISMSIVGMGGIGKTTLAKQVYLNPLVNEHFDVCLFVEIGIEYKLEELLLRLLGGRVNFTGRGEAAVEKLGENLYQHLRGRRYLVVLDDIWGIEAWDELRRFFPDNSIGSRIIFTTRISNIARSAADTIIEKRFLDDDESWELLRKMALSDMEEVCPPELENVGKTIVRKLGGLPLAIVMIGRLLSSSETTVESWMTVSQNLHSLIEESTILAFLSLSYTQLPQHLKACFLYLGLFPPNSKIATSLLIKLWVAEGFIEDNDVGNKSLEEKAEEYLHDLVSRSLVIIDELTSCGGIKTCRIHGILQDLCVSKARLEKLFHIVHEGTATFTQSTKDQRRLGIYTDVILGSEELDSDARSLVFICPQNQHPLEVNLNFRWLRVLHSLSIRFWEFPYEVMKLVRLKYLAITYDGKLPPSISRLRNLEFLIIHRSQNIKPYVFLPLEIWKLQKLRHLECMGFDLPDPSAAAAKADGNVLLHLKRLVTLLGVSSRSCTAGVLARTPNLIKLGIQFEPTDYKVELFCFDAVSSCLHRLESFKCVVTVMNRDLGSQHAFPLDEFPTSLKKLTLSGCGFVWGEHMTIISQLPNLQVLKLRWHAFSGTEWEACEDGFVRLKWLVLEDLDLVRWKADDIHFPRLEQLHIRRCYNLTEIPSGIGYIPTLQLIVVDDCSESVIESARRIREEQQELYGYEAELQVRIHSSSDG